MTISQKGVMFLQGKVLSHYFTTKQYRIKRFFSRVHACINGADALTHTLSAPFWEMVMLRKQDTLILNVSCFLNMTISQKGADKVCVSASAPFIHA
jgi:hypothetical protein